MNSTVAERHRRVAARPLDPVVLDLEGDARCRRRRSAAGWRWRRGGCSARDRRAPPWARRTGAWRRRTSASSSAAPGRRRRPLRRRGARARRRSYDLPAVCAPASFSSISRRNSLESTSTGRKKLGRQRDPALGRPVKAAAGHDHVHVRMMRHRRAPGVQHRCDADAGAEVLAGRPRSSASSRPRP